MISHNSNIDVEHNALLTRPATDERFLANYRSETPSAAVGTNESGGQNASAVLHSLRRQWIAAAVIGVCFSVPTVLLVWMLQKPALTSAAFLRIASADVPLVFETADKAGRSDYKTYKNTQKQLLLNPLVLNRALRDPAIAALPAVIQEISPADWLQKELIVDFPGDAEIMRVSLTCEDPKSAQALVDSVINAYMIEIVDAEKAVRQKRLENLETVYRSADSKLRVKRGELSATAENLGTSDSATLSLAQQGAVQHFSLVRNELTKIEFARMRAEGELQLFIEREKQASSNDSKSAVNDETVPNAAVEAQKRRMELELEYLAEDDTEIAKLKNAISELNSEIENVKTKFTEKAAERYLSEHYPRLEELQKKLNGRLERLRLRFAEQSVSVDGGRPALEMEVAVLKNQESQMRAEVVRLEQESRKFGKSSVNVDMLHAEISGLDAVVARVAQEIERTNIELQSSSRITVLFPASAPQPGDPKKPIAITAMAGLMGLLLPTGVLVFRDLGKRHVNGISAAADDIGLTVLGSVPKLPQRTLRRLQAIPVNGSNLSGALLDSMGSVTAMVMRHGAVDGKRMIVVSSAMAGEGKSTFARQLAYSLSLAGHHTLLVDFDLRRPGQHRALNLPLSPGIADVFNGNIELTAAIRSTACDGLDVLTAGEWQENLLRVESQGIVARLMRELRPEYDFVIIDASPILPTADTRIIAKYADGVILTLLKDVSQIPKVIKARDVMSEFKIPVLGTVVSGCAEEAYYAKA